MHVIRGRPVSRSIASKVRQHITARVKEASAEGGRYPGLCKLVVESAARRGGPEVKRLDHALGRVLLAEHFPGDRAINVYISMPDRQVLVGRYTYSGERLKTMAGNVPETFFVAFQGGRSKPAEEGEQGSKPGVWIPKRERGQMLVPGVAFREPTAEEINREFDKAYLEDEKDERERCKTARKQPGGARRKPAVGAAKGKKEELQYRLA